MADGNTQALVVQAPPRSVIAAMSDRYGMEPAAFEATLRATVVQKATREEFAAFLLVAKEYGLNPLTKEVYAFPAKGGGIVPVVSVDGWARIINDHPAFDGMAFHDVFDPKTGDLVAITCRMYRKDRTHPIETTEYMAECRRGTDVWKQWPRRMLRHKALIQCARMAFGFSGIYDEDEYQRMGEAPPPRPREVRTLHAGFDDVGPAPPAEAGREPEPIHDAQVEEIDPETGEFLPDDVEVWAKRVVVGLGHFDNVDNLRAAWDERKDELKAANPERWREVNQAVAARAMAIAGESAS